jgi:RNA polymerase sigma-70 factor (ECF subfamily)
MNISELWQENADFVLRVCMRFVDSMAAAEDIRQEVFLKVINSEKPFKERSSIRTWLYSITYNCCMDYFREQRRQQEITDEFSRAGTFYLKDSQSPVWEVNDISEMPSPLSQLFVELCFGEGWNREEIAQVFGFSVDYVGKKIQAGLRQLRKMI